MYAGYTRFGGKQDERRSQVRGQVVVQCAVYLLSSLWSAEWEWGVSKKGVVWTYLQQTQHKWKHLKEIIHAALNNDFPLTIYWKIINTDSKMELELNIMRM